MWGRTAILSPILTGHLTTRVINLARQLGYIAGFSTIPGTYECDSFIMSLHRLHIGNAPLSSYGI